MSEYNVPTRTWSKIKTQAESRTKYTTENFGGFFEATDDVKGVDVDKLLKIEVRKTRLERAALVETAGTFYMLQTCMRCNCS